MIQEYKYGMFKVDNRVYYDDIKLLGTKVKFWECRTREIRLEDIQDLLEIKPQMIIIGLGAGGLISVSDGVKEALRMRRITLVSEKNQKAAEAYNDALNNGKNVAAIFPGRG